MTGIPISRASLWNRLCAGILARARGAASVSSSSGPTCPRCMSIQAIAVFAGSSHRSKASVEGTGVFFVFSIQQ